MTSHPYPYQPQASAVAVNSEERNWGMLSHGIPLAATVLSAGTLGFVASLVMYVLAKDRSPFVRQHAANALNVQLTELLGLIISIPLMFVLVGFVTYPIVVVWAIVVHILGVVAANRGESYRAPFTIGFVR